MRRVVSIGPSQRGCRGEPSRIAAHRLEDGVLVHSLHISGQAAALLDRECDVARGRRVSRRMVGCVEIVVHSLWYADSGQIVARGTAVLLNAVDSVHRIVAANVEQKANVVPLEKFLDPG